MTQNPDPSFLIFDTDCILCSRLVHFLVHHERKPDIHFVGAWGKSGGELAARFGYSQEDLSSTFLFIAGGDVFDRSDAALQLVRRLKPPWSWLAVLRLVPKPVRDAAYRLVANNRYKWFGRSEKCFVSKFDSLHRFIRD